VLIRVFGRAFREGVGGMPKHGGVDGQDGEGNGKNDRTGAGIRWAGQMTNERQAVKEQWENANISTSGEK